MSVREPVKIFVSYKKDGEQKGDREGRKFVEELLPFVHMEATESDTAVDIWYDKALLPGSEWEPGIEKALNDAEIFVLVYATGFFDPEGFIALKELPVVVKHLRAAKRRNRTVIPIVRAGVDLPHGIPDDFRDLRRVQAAYEGRSIGNLDDDLRAEAMREVAKSVIASASAVYSGRQSTSLRPIVDGLGADLDCVDVELSRDPRTSPEDQLKSPVKKFLERAAPVLGRQSVAVFTEHRSARGDHIQGVRLDLSVKRSSGELIGHIELKSPDKDANPKTGHGWSDHDRKQWKKLRDHPNLIYCNGREWTLWRQGVDYPLGQAELTADASGAIPDYQVRQLAELLGSFLSWTPIVPSTPRALAKRLAPLAGLLRDAVVDHVSTLKDKDEPESRRGLSAMYANWTQDLMPGATIKEFADSFAQTFTYALLLARIEAGGFEPLRTENVSSILSSHGHRLLGSVLQLMNQNANREPVEAALALLESTIGAVDPERLTAKSDPWLYFYEDFLAEYDENMRKDAGVYYTPIEVVQAQVRLVNDVLRTRFGLNKGFGDDNVKVLDPALGTGTYLLSVASKVLDESATPEDDARSLAGRLNGFELLVGPYAVAHLRLTQMLERKHADLGANGVNIFLTNTLTDPGEVSDSGQQISLWEVLQNVTEDNRRAGIVKKDRTDIRVIMGNPPYDRGSKNKSLGAGSQKNPNIVLQAVGSNDPLLDDFINPLRQTGQGGQAKNLYNSYVYFWRWAIWKACEQNPETPGIVSFITSSSYLRGPGFAGMREYMRRMFDEIWIIDLGGEGRGAVKEDNVFNIQTPVCIAVCVQRATNAKGNRIRFSDRRRAKAEVWYQAIIGDSADKLKGLANVQDPYVSGAGWTSVPANDFGSKFSPGTTADFGSLPLITSVFPWFASGTKAGRKWVIASEEVALKRRLEILNRCQTIEEKRELFKDSPTGRKVDAALTKTLLPGSFQRSAPSDGIDVRRIPLVPYGYRSFDRQYVLADPRFIDRPGPLWGVFSQQQVYLATLTSTGLGKGPAVTVSGVVPDLDFFRGSFGAKSILPLYRDPGARTPNVAKALLEGLTAAYGFSPSAEDVASYVVGLLGTGVYTERFARELKESVARVPFTKDPQLFREVANLGCGIVRHQTFGDRFGLLNQFGQLEPLQLRGKAELKVATPWDADRYPETFEYKESTKELTIGEGIVANVSPEVMAFEVSGMKVVRSWLGYRMKIAAGRTSSPLDRVHAEHWEFDAELLELLWVVEYMVDVEPRAAELLDRVMAAPLVEVPGLDYPTDSEKAGPTAMELAQPEELLPIV